MCCCLFLSHTTRSLYSCLARNLSKEICQWYSLLWKSSVYCMYGCIGQDFCAVDFDKPLMPVNVCRVTILTTICMLSFSPAQWWNYAQCCGWLFKKLKLKSLLVDPVSYGPLNDLQPTMTTSAPVCFREPIQDVLLMQKFLVEAVIVAVLHCPCAEMRHPGIDALH